MCIFVYHRYCGTDRPTSSASRERGKENLCMCVRDPQVRPTSRILKKDYLGNPAFFQE
jgi:hypothetical protein